MCSSDLALGAPAGERSGADYIDAQRHAVALLGDAIYANPFLLGWAWQRGWIPLQRASLLRAIELNGASVDRNQLAFEWGRRAAHDPAKVQALVTPPATVKVVELKRPATLDELVARRVEYLSAYQNPAYAQRYADFVAKVRNAEGAKLGGKQLTTAVAKYLFKLMAYKDEYEVARLYTDPAFLNGIEAQFEGDYKLVFHLAPPAFAKRNARGELVKRRYGPWMLGAFGVLAKLKFLRGTVFDPFGHSEERRTERRLIADYTALIDELLVGLDDKNLSLAVELARIPEDIRGYGHVKLRHLAAAKAHEAELLASWRSGGSPKARVIALHAA